MNIILVPNVVVVVNLMVWVVVVGTLVWCGVGAVEMVVDLGVVERVHSYGDCGGGGGCRSEGCSVRVFSGGCSDCNQ